MSKPSAPRQARHLRQVTARPPSSGLARYAAPGDEVLAHEASSSDAPIGILAGGGSLPRTVADSIIASGGRVHIVGLKGEADASIEDYSHNWCNWGAIGGMLRSFRRARCKELIIIGAVRRPDLARIKPDLGFFRSLPLVLALMRGGDDSVLSKVVRFFERQGFVVRGAHEVAPQLLAGTGPMGAHAATPEQARAIAKGTALLHALAPFDIGQAVLATAQEIIAVEGTAGTDAMIRGAVALVKSGAKSGAGSGTKTGAKSAAATGTEASRLQDMVLVKLPKPGQELRVDMPTIGPATIDLLHAARVTGVAVATNATLMLERDRLIAMADNAGLFVTGIEDDTDPAASKLSASQLAPIEACAPLTALGRVGPRPRDWQDIDLAARLLMVLKRQDAGHAVVVSRNHVLAVQSIEPLTQLLQSLGRGQPWGSLLPRRRGVLALRARHDGAAGQSRGYPAVDADVVKGAQKAWIAGIVFCDAGVGASAPGRQVTALADGSRDAAGQQPPMSDDALAAADHSGMFIIATQPEARAAEPRRPEQRRPKDRKPMVPGSGGQGKADD